MSGYCIETCRPDDWAAWQTLTREVEPLFGPMADQPEFTAAWQAAVAAQQVLCAREAPSTGASPLLGGIIFSPKENEIAWLAVSARSRGKGVGAKLLAQALQRLDPTRNVRVQTFVDSVPAGQPARRLYQRFGFIDQKMAGDNPAGYATVIMIRTPQDRD
jgi:GNAT superfamily N-acetyltransferase